MISIRYEWFANTTAEDQASWFCGETYTPARGQAGEYLQMTPGEYRVIDGEVYKITSDIPSHLSNEDFIF